MPWGPHLVPGVLPPEFVNEASLKDLGLKWERHPVKPKPHLEAVGDTLRHEPLGGVVAYRVAVHPAPQICSVSYVDSVNLPRELAYSKFVTRWTIILDVLLIGPMFMPGLE